MPNLDLADIRRLRANAASLLRHQPDDLIAFLNAKNKLTYRRLPEQLSRPSDVKVTSSCSCLMSIALSKQFSQVYDSKSTKSAQRAFQRIYNASWRSSGLGLNNAFSTVLVIRSFGLLVEAGVLDSTFALTKRRNFSPLGRVTLSAIAGWLASDIDNFGINKYPASAALVYWFVDGVDRAKIPLRPTYWRRLSNWAQEEFIKQRSLVAAEHDALMDPVAMVMAACLCARLRTIADESKSPTVSSCLEVLPSVVELRHAVKVLFDKQSPSGIWPKYFPLFHYPKAGSNYCFTYEMLEAVLAEFGTPDSDLLATQPILKKLENALNWCFENRLKYSVKNRTYYGWNSGGELDSLHHGKPESWATAVVYMFLWELQHMLATKTQAILLREYNASPPTRDPRPWNDMLDMEVRLQGRATTTTVRKVLELQIVRPALKYQPFTVEKIDGALSALLFGPPGTSKTRLAAALAGLLGWPLVLIDPSRFLDKGIEQIYSRATEIFRDLEDLSAVVVLFDEMDALVRTRDGQRIDLTSQFLTTSMLPKLATLHDQGSLVFLFATNYQADFDPAIKRPGRFDVLLCVGPPSWKEKLRRIDKLLAVDTVPNEINRARKKLKSLSGGLNKEETKPLNLLTVKEAANFLSTLSSRRGSAVASVRSITLNQFKSRLASFSKFMTIRLGSDTYERYSKDQKESRIQ